MNPTPDPRPLPLDQLAERGVQLGQGEAPALILRGEELSHEALRQRVSLFAAWLRAAVPKAGSRVASWAAKGEITCLLPLAAARAGLVHVPINPLLKRGQVAHILADSGARLLIGTPARLASLEGTDVPADCALLEENVAIADMHAHDGALGPSDADPDDLAAILYTSGSTGAPKGVMLSHANMWLGAVSVAHYLGLAPDDRTLGVLPFSFDYGQNQLFSSWYAGGAVIPLDYLVPRDVMKACLRHRITTLAAVPPLWIQLMQIEWPGEATRAMRRLTNSGGALTASLVKQMRAVFPGADLYPMYGLTEAFRSTYLDPALVDEHPTAIGRAVPFAQVLVLDEGGTPCKAGVEGELVHCGPLVAKGYWRDAARTAERFRPAPSASSHGGMAVWSGDRVMRDAEGLLHFVGRRDAMIKSAGNRISPAEIEEIGIAFPGIAEAVALGIADERLGQAIHLVVRGDPDTAQRADFAAYLAHELPNFMRPQAIHWRSAMPLNPNGKIDRARLQRELEMDGQ